MTGSILDLADDKAGIAIDLGGLELDDADSLGEEAYRAVCDVLEAHGHSPHIASYRGPARPVSNRKGE